MISGKCVVNDADPVRVMRDAQFESLSLEVNKEKHTQKRQDSVGMYGD